MNLFNKGSNVKYIYLNVKVSYSTSSYHIIKCMRKKSSKSTHSRRWNQEVFDILLSQFYLYSYKSQKIVSWHFTNSRSRPVSAVSKYKWINIGIQTPPYLVRVRQLSNFQCGWKRKNQNETSGAIYSERLNFYFNSRVFLLLSLSDSNQRTEQSVWTQWSLIYSTV